MHPCFPSRNGLLCTGAHWNKWGILSGRDSLFSNKFSVNFGLSQAGAGNAESLIGVGTTALPGSACAVTMCWARLPHPMGVRLFVTRVRYPLLELISGDLSIVDTSVRHCFRRKCYLSNHYFRHLRVQVRIVVPVPEAKLHGMQCSHGDHDAMRLMGMPRDLLIHPVLPSMTHQMLMWCRSQFARCSRRSRLASGDMGGHNLDSGIGTRTG